MRLFFVLNWLLASTAGAMMTALPVHAGDDEAQMVKTGVARFHEALNVLFTGDAAPMKAAWSHADDVTYMGPVGGKHVGWSKVEADWDKQASLKLGGKVVVSDLNVTAGKDLSVATYIEKGENIVDGKTQVVSIRATTTFRKENGNWKVIGHHTDTLPYLKK